MKTKARKNNIAKHRMIEKNLTVTEIAERIGRSKSTVSMVLRGKLKSAVTAKKIAGILGIKMSDLGHSETERKTGRGRRNSIRDDIQDLRQRIRSIEDRFGVSQGPPGISIAAILELMQSPAICKPEDVDRLTREIKAAKRSANYRRLF